jgi:hypothetical protein
MPGIRLPIFSPDIIFERKPDYILILPWNLKDEIKAQLAQARDWGARFIVPVPIAQVED